ncbi:MAG: FGGY family carbohydrate kinase [Clostridia bacterium]|nr:FGGY family carbohydrate kinase [Clostridia bacterium]NLV33388.1 hypothetical protein [Clostridiaceae bacterium]HQM95474.1 FGGY family carbohydrate kinase [Clostridia bacterium]HQO68934.1 FGGY family carbohydrate kinase [Clostridia bacterium]
MIALGLDIGTSKICVSVIESGTGKCLENFHALNNTFIFIDNKQTKMQDAKAIKDKAFNLIEMALSKYPNIGCIGVTGQMHGIVYIKDDFSIASPLFTWQDESGDLQYEDSGLSHAENLTKLTGYKMATGYGLTTLYYHMHQKIDFQASYISTIHSYVACCMADCKKPVLHSSDAHSLGLYNLDNNRFDCKALEKAGINERILPDVVNSPVILGKYRNRIPVCVAIGDNQAGFMGSGCIDDILVNIGTGSQISLKTDIISIISPDIEIRPLSDDKHIFVGASLCGGRAFAILKSFYEDVIEMAGFTSPENLYDIMLQNMNLPNNESDLVFSTLFCGTRNDPTAKASITNLTADNFTTADITYAALKGISNELYAMYNAIKKYDSSKRIRLIGSGNGIRKNPLLRNILEKTFSMSLSIPVNTEEAAYGAALYALTSTGFFKSVEQAQKMVEFEDEHE